MDVLLAGEVEGNSIALLDSVEFDNLIEELNKNMTI